MINACEICDHKNGYVLDSKKKSCEESSDTNCILYGRDIKGWFWVESLGFGEGSDPLIDLGY